MLSNVIILFVFWLFLYLGACRVVSTVWNCNSATLRPRPTHICRLDAVANTTRSPFLICYQMTSPRKPTPRFRRGRDGRLTKSI